MNRCVRIIEDCDKDKVVEDMIALFYNHRKYFGLTNKEFPDYSPEDKQCEFEDEFIKLICKYKGHDIGPNQCGKPEHDLCYNCNRLKSDIESNCKIREISIGNNVMNLLIQCEEEFDAFKKLCIRDRRTLMRSLMKTASQSAKDGKSETEIISDCHDDAKLLEDYDSILLVIGLAALSAIIEWVVKKILDKIFNESKASNSSQT